MLADYTLHITDEFISGLTFFLIGVAYGMVGITALYVYQRRKGR